MNQIKSKWQERIIADCLFVEFEINSENQMTAQLNVLVKIDKLPIGYELTRGEHVIHCLEEPDVVTELHKLEEIESLTAPTVRGLLDVLESLGYHDVVEQFDEQELPEFESDKEIGHREADKFASDLLGDTVVGDHYDEGIGGVWYA